MSWFPRSRWLKIREFLSIHLYYQRISFPRSSGGTHAGTLCVQKAPNILDVERMPPQERRNEESRNSNPDETVEKLLLNRQLLSEKDFF
jgi:hypothetical protein